jgi:hypothetical protein
MPWCFFSGHGYISTYLYLHWSTEKQYAGLFLRFFSLLKIYSSITFRVSALLFETLYERVSVCVCVCVKGAKKKQMRIYNVLVFVFFNRLKNVKT